MAGPDAAAGGTALAEVVVADLEVTVPAPDARAAVAACGPLVERTGALVRGVTRVPGEGALFEVRLARTEALAADESVVEGMQRVNRRLLAALGRPEEPATDHPRRMSGVSFVDDDGAVLPPGTYVSTVVRMSDVEDPFEGYERLEPEWPDGGPVIAEADAAELAAAVQALAWTTVVLVAHVVDRDPVEAREDLRALVAGVDHEVFLSQPEADGDGLRLWAVLGMADEPAADLLEQAVAALSVPGWTVREERPAGAVVADWAPAHAPDAGITRLELRIGNSVVGLGEAGLTLAP